MRYFVLRLVALTLVAIECPWPVVADTRLISEPAAAEHGLTRAWFTQISMDRSRSQVEHVVLEDGTLYVQTNRAMLHALDAETGQALWSQQAGNPAYPSLRPGVGGDLVATVNGASLFVLNRYNGDLLWTTKLDVVPGAGPVLSMDRVYVPMVNGLVRAYRMTPVVKAEEEEIEKIANIEKEAPTAEQKKEQEIERRESLRLDQKNVEQVSCQSFGRIIAPPIITRSDKAVERVAWSTDHGSIFVAQIEARESPRFVIGFQVAVESEVVGRLAFLPPNPAANRLGLIVYASRNGTVRAIDEADGSLQWHASTGDAILEPVALIDEQGYVATQSGGMYCLGATNGQVRWRAPGVKHFVAASKDRVYAVDALGQIQVLSVETGQRVDTLSTASIPIALGNVTTDRIYLATESGLIQCLHEVELREPLEHGRVAAAVEEPKPAVKPTQPEAEPPHAAGPPVATRKRPATEHKAIEKTPKAEAEDRPLQRQPRTRGVRGSRAKAKAAEAAGEGR